MVNQSKYYVFTYNNHSQGDRAVLCKRAIDAGATYFVAGHETGESGTRHLQGYLELSNRTRLSTIKARLGFTTIHYEKRCATALQASNYCKKDDDYLEWGTLSKQSQGKRSDLDDLKKDLLEAQALTDITMNHFGSFLRYERSIKSFRFIHSIPRNPMFPPSIIVYWGDTGTGKTRAVWDNIVSFDQCWVYPGKGWFDGYDNQPVALFDDFRGSSMEVHLLLQVLDRYPLKVRIKGSHVNWNPREIYLTSNLPPEEWYPGVDQRTRDALMRRFTNVVQF